MIQRQLYGWFDKRQRVFRLSAMPPDSPIRPSLALEHKSNVDELVARKHVNLLWWPPLHPDEERL